MLSLSRVFPLTPPSTTLSRCCFKSPCNRWENWVPESLLTCPKSHGGGKVKARLKLSLLDAKSCGHRHSWARHLLGNKMGHSLLWDVPDWNPHSPTCPGGLKHGMATSSSAQPLAPCNFLPCRLFCDPMTSAYLPHAILCSKGKFITWGGIMPTFTIEQLRQEKMLLFLPQSCFPVTFSSNSNNISNNHKQMSKPDAYLSLCSPLVLCM